MGIFLGVNSVLMSLPKGHWHVSAKVTVVGSFRFREVKYLICSFSVERG